MIIQGGSKQGLIHSDQNNGKIFLEKNTFRLPSF